MHENVARTPDVKRGSERSFGLVFTAVFAVIGLWPLWEGGVARWWAMAVAVSFMAVALARPSMLKPLNRTWFKMGQLLQRIVNPIVMGLLFFSAVLPVAMALRAFGKDPLRLRFDDDAESYWIERRPPGPDPETMRQQF